MSLIKTIAERHLVDKQQAFALTQHQVGHADAGCDRGVGLQRRNNDKGWDGPTVAKNFA